MPSTHLHPVPVTPHRALATAAWFVAIGAYGGAVGLVTGWLSLGDRLNGRLPFSSPVFGGFALLLLVAVPYTALARRAWRGDGSTGATSMVVGGLTVVWIVVQLAFLRELSLFHPLYAAIGVAFVVAGRHVRARTEPEIDLAAVGRFLEQRRIVLIGASDDTRKFSNTVCKELVGHGYDVAPVNPRRALVRGIRCVPDLASVPGEIEAVLVMVTGPAALAAVRDCVACGVPRVWLFRGVGTPGAMSPEAVALCREHGIDVVAGACPLMFLPPVEAAHHTHLVLRRFAGAVR